MFCAPIPLIFPPFPGSTIFQRRHLPVYSKLGKTKDRIVAVEQSFTVYIVPPGAGRNNGRSVKFSKDKNRAILSWLEGALFSPINYSHFVSSWRVCRIGWPSMFQ